MLDQPQSGGFLGTSLASIGVPLLLNALTGKGLQVDRHRSRRSANVYVPEMHKMPEMHIPIQKIAKQSTTGGLVLPMDYMSPPFYGTGENQIGMGVKPKKKRQKKKASGKGLLLGKNSPFNNIPILGAIL